MFSFWVVKMINFKIGEHRSALPCFTLLYYPEPFCRKVGLVSVFPTRAFHYVKFILINIIIKCLRFNTTGSFFEILSYPANILACEMRWGSPWTQARSWCPWEWSGPTTSAGPRPSSGTFPSGSSPRCDVLRSGLL